MGHGNTRFNASEFNFLKDPVAAHTVFNSVKHLVMVPIECSRAFCVLNSDYMDQAFTQKTKKVELVNKAFAVAYENSRN